MGITCTRTQRGHETSQTSQVRCTSRIKFRLCQKFCPHPLSPPFKASQLCVSTCCCRALVSVALQSKICTVSLYRNCLHAFPMLCRMLILRWPTATCMVHSLKKVHGVGACIIDFPPEAYTPLRLASFGTVSSLCRLSVQHSLPHVPYVINMQNLSTTGLLNSRLPKKPSSFPEIPPFQCHCGLPCGGLNSCLP